MSRQHRQPDAKRSDRQMGTIVPHVPREVAQTPFGPAHTPGERIALNELNAMHAIGEALAEVSEEETRARVLAWAVRLFAEGSEARKTVERETRPPAPPQPSTHPEASDDALSLAGLETMFSGERVPRTDVPTPIIRARKTALATIRFNWRR